MGKENYPFCEIKREESMKCLNICVIGVATVFLFFFSIALPLEAESRELARKQVFHLGVEAGDLDFLDPAKAANSSSIPQLDFVFSALVRWPTGRVTPDEYQPDLAEKWELSEDGKEWTFYLRKGIKWHRGYGEVTAEDIKFSLERMAKPFSHWNKEYEHFKEIEALDKYTVKITLDEKDPFFLSKVCNFQGGYIVCRKAIIEAGAADRPLNPTQKEIIGTGGFIFESYTPNEKVVYVRNDDWHRGRAILEKVVVHFIPLVTSRELALVKGEVHAIRGDLQQSWVDLMKKKGMIVDMVGPTVFNVLHINTSREPFNDIKIRKALCHTLDRRMVAKYFGEDIARPLLSPIPPGYFGHVSTGIPTYEYDPEKAKRLLTAGGYSNGFEIELFVSSWKEYLDLYKILQEQMAAVGIKAKYKAVEHSQYHINIRKDLNPLVDIGWKKFPIADGILREFYHSSAIVGTASGITNFSHYNKIDDLIDKGISEMNFDKKRKIYAECQRRILEDAVAYPVVTLVLPLVRQPFFDLAYDMKETLTFSYQIDPSTAILKH
jgi:peptide/nickel transport system substrate-binding protein